MDIEQLILSQLIHNDKFARAVLPYMKAEYFADDTSRVVFDLIEKFSTKYGNPPNVDALEIELDRNDKVDQDKYDSAVSLIRGMKTPKPQDQDWLLETTETYVKERAMQNALREAISIQKDDARSNGEIETVMRDALGISFDSKLGHDYFADAEARYDHLHQSISKIPFDLDILNEATKGGVEKKTLNLFMAGCVHPQTTVVARYQWNGIERVKEITMIRLQELVNSNIEVFVDSPSGFVRVVEFVDKGLYPEYVISTDTLKSVRCNADHLVMTTWGWERAEVLAQLCDHNVTRVNIQVKGGWESANVMKIDHMIPIVDIIVDHPEHHYYANGINSHNTNIGKSLIMCHFAGAHIKMGYNVLYITLEMAEEKIAQRLDANLLDISLDQYDAMPKEWFLRKVAEVKKKCGGNFRVREFPSNMCHVGHIRFLLQELKLKEGFVPDVIYVDYLTIMSCQRFKSNVARHTYIQGVAQELRALGQTEGVPIFSALQLNREGFDSSDAGITDIAGSWDLTGDADWIVVITQTEDLEERGQYMWKQDKSRYSDKGKLRKFMTGVDKSKMRIYDLDQQPIHSESQDVEEPEANSFDSFFQQK